MSTSINNEYDKITGMYFAVWNMVKPVNFVWVDFAGRTVRCGSWDNYDDPMKAAKDFEAKRGEEFVDLISYDENGQPIYTFEEQEFKYPGVPAPADKKELLAFLETLESIDLLGWRASYPSLRDGLCWRIDLYTEEGDRHFSGQARFPKEWTAFGKALNKLVESTKQTEEK